MVTSKRISWARRQKAADAAERAAIETLVRLRKVAALLDDVVRRADAAARLDAAIRLNDARPRARG